jgi:hypothetical protein
MTNRTRQVGRGNTYDWTDGRIRRLRLLAKEGYSIVDMTHVFGISENTLAKKIDELGLDIVTRKRK